MLGAAMIDAVRLIRSGGFGAVPPRQVEVSPTDLPAVQRGILEDKVAAAAFFTLPPVLLDGAAPDGFEYQLAVSEAGLEHTVRTADGAVPEELFDLITYVLEL